MYQPAPPALLRTMHMITPGVAASLTPKSLEHDAKPARPARSEAAAPVRAPRRLHVPRVLLHLPHPHLPHRHA